MAVEFAADRAVNAGRADITRDIQEDRVTRDRLAADAGGHGERDAVQAFRLRTWPRLSTKLSSMPLSHVARHVGIVRVLLTGGCFQNARLTERAIAKLSNAGFDPYWHHRIPPNDGGLAVGQAAFAARPLIGEIA